jgi:hypothetical protein
MHWEHAHRSVTTWHFPGSNVSIDEPHSLGPVVHRFDFSLQYDPVDSVHVVVPQEHISELFGLKFGAVPCVFKHISMHLLASNTTTTTIGLTQSVHDAFPTSFWYFPASQVLHATDSDI